MTQLFFGTAGIPNSAQSDTTIDGIKRIAELGLGCMEMEFVHGVKLNEAGARLAGEGEVSARSYVTQLGELDPLLLNEIAEEIRQRQAAGNPVAADLVRMVTRDH